MLAQLRDVAWRLAHAFPPPFRTQLRQPPPVAAIACPASRCGMAPCPRLPPPNHTSIAATAACSSRYCLALRAAPCRAHASPPIHTSIAAIAACSSRCLPSSAMRHGASPRYSMGVPGGGAAAPAAEPVVSTRRPGTAWNTCAARCGVWSTAWV
eukprot:358038-Chlamydomonas_euryale.AAC.1